MGEYEVIRLIGEGGMGWVYLARDTRLGRKVALKVIHPDLFQSAGARENLLREAAATARFSHPNIVTIYALGELEGGAPYLALEYLEGQTLRERSRQDAIPQREVLRIGQAVASALAEAHRHGILHRDIKPDNVFLQRDGRVRVLDFGLAQVLPAERSHGGEAGDISAAGVAGTVGYIAPELWAPGTALAPTADIWSLGVLLLELLSGARPADSDAPAALRPLGLPPHVELLLGLCLSRDSAARPTAADLAEALASIPRARGRRSLFRPDASPYRGLLPFHREHADFFFGRECEVQEVARRLREQPLIAVVGPPGAGKSSLVQAGLIPALEEEGYCRGVVVRPGRRPLLALAQQLARSASVTLVSAAELLHGAPEEVREVDSEDALQRQLRARPGLLGSLLRETAHAHRSRILLAVDQFEEVFTQTEDPEDRSRFLDALLAAADDPDGPVRVVLTVRDDFLGRIAEVPSLAAPIERGVFLLQVPQRPDLIRILTEPLAQCGCRFEDEALVASMVAEVEGQPAALPLLQFAARRMWDERDGGRGLLLRSVYQRIGGVAGALADHADRVMDAMSGPGARAARAVLLRLVTAEGARAVLERQTLLDEVGDEAKEALRQLIDARLVVTRPQEGDREGAVELAHESLVLRWTRLRRWREENREDLETLEYLRAAVRRWVRAGRREADLLRGQSLAEALRWRDRRAIEPAAEVQGYLDQSAAVARRHERRRRRLTALAVLVLLLVALLSAGAALRIAREERRAKRNQAEAERALSQALLEAAQADVLQEDLAAARAKLRSALGLQDSVAGRALWHQLKTQPLQLAANLGVMAYAVAFGPDGRRLAAGGADGVIRIWDLASGEAVSLRAGDPTSDLAFSDDGRFLVSGGNQGTVQLWDLPSHAGRMLEPRVGPFAGVAVSRDGTLVAAGGRDGRILVWDRHGSRVVDLTGHQAWSGALAFLPDGSLISAGSDVLIRRWDLYSGRFEVLASADTRVPRVATDLEGKQLAFGDAKGAIHVRTMGCGRTRVLHGHTSALTSVALDSRGELLASAAPDGLRLWRLASGESVMVPGHKDRVYDVALSRGGGLLASASLDQTVRVWSTARLALHAGGGHTDRVQAVAFDGTGQTLASGSVDGTVRFWEVKSGRSRAAYRLEQAVNAIALSRDGRLLAAAGSDRTARVWNLKDGASKMLVGHQASINSATFSVDGRWLATGSEDETARVWDLESGQSQVLGGHGAQVWSVAFLPGARRLASACARRMRLWDLATGRAQMLGNTEGSFLSVGLDPAGRYLAAGTTDRAWLWDLKDTGRDHPVAEAKIDGSIWGVAFHPGGKLLATASDDTSVRLWTVPEMRPAGRACCHRGSVNAVAFSPDGRLLVTGGDDGTVRLWDLEGHSLWRPRLVLPAARSSGTWTGHLLAEAQRVDLSADGRWLGAVLAGGQVELWDVRQGIRLQRVHLADADRAIPSAEGLAVLAGGRVTLTGSDGKARRVLPVQNVTALAQAGDRVAIATREELRLLHVGTDGLVARLSLEKGASVSEIVLLPGHLLVGYSSGALERWTLGSSAPPYRFAGTRPHVVMRMAPGPMGTLIVGQADGTVTLWNTADGKPMLSGRLHGAIVQLLLDGKKLHAVSELGDQLTWDLTAFFCPYCELLRAVWSEIPMEWVAGRALRASGTPVHICARALPAEP